MTRDELEMFFDGLRKEGKTDDEILGTLYLMFQGGDLTLEELQEVIGVLGYEFTDEFAAMSPEDQLIYGVAPILRTDYHEMEIKFVHHGTKGVEQYYGTNGDGIWWGIKSVRGRFKNEFCFDQKKRSESEFKAYITKKYPNYTLRLANSDDKDRLLSILYH